MKLKSNEVSDITGLSISGIRFYEKEGLIRPARTQDSNYREYSPEDLELLFALKFFRKCGFSVKESIDLVNSRDLSYIRTAYDNRCRSLEKELAELYSQKELLEEQGEILEMLQLGLPVIRFQKRPAFWWIGVIQPKDHLPDSGEGLASLPYLTNEGVGRWAENSPYCRSSLQIPAEIFMGDALPEDSALRTVWGMGIQKKHAELLNFHPEETFQDYPECFCIQSVVKVDPDRTIPAGQLKEIRDYMKTRGLICKGTILTHRILNLTGEEQKGRYDYIYIPI